MRALRYTAACRLSELLFVEFRRRRRHGVAFRNALVLKGVCAEINLHSQRNLMGHSSQMMFTMPSAQHHSQRSACNGEFLECLTGLQYSAFCSVYSPIIHNCRT